MITLIVFVRLVQQFHQYQVVGRALPTATNETPKAYRMKLWATNEVRAKSKFWYVPRSSVSASRIEWFVLEGRFISLLGPLKKCI